MVSSDVHGPSDIDAAINVRLALLGLPLADGAEGLPEERLVAPLLARQQELSRRLSDHLCPADTRIQGFLNDYLSDTDLQPRLPRRTFVLDMPGLARGMSLPVGADEFSSDLVHSYRLHNGVLHNPFNDRRTTAGVFHIAEGGLPIPADKRAVPKPVFAKLLDLATRPPTDHLQLPFTSTQENKAGCFVSLLLRPLVRPAVAGHSPEKRMEIRFIVPGGLVSNLDFVEGIFGNGGDPHLPEHDASLDPTGWTGHTGCVILAPHLTGVTKKELGLPHISEATERQVRDRMCWTEPDEKYNDGQAFKICARDERGVIVTVIADNYFGYCKKEVKTQIGYSANLSGLSEEEHAGGAMVFPAYNEGLEFFDKYSEKDVTVQQVVDQDPDRFDLQPQGHALDRYNPAIIMVPAETLYSLRDLTVSWDNGHGGRESLPLRADKTYFSPSGYRVRMAQSVSDPTQWYLTGISAQATNCHKPSTVSGGGKSEISKALTDAIVFGSAYVRDFDADMDAVETLLERDWSNRFADPARNGEDQRSILSEFRSMGSVIKLLTPSTDFNDAHNEFINSIPPHIQELVFVIKRFYRPEWQGDWRSHFSVGIINGRQGNQLRLDGEKIVMHQLRVGFDADGSWRLFGLRPDFAPATKVQTEDDITASTVAPNVRTDGRAGKIAENCERLLFQRPDDAKVRGYDKQAELDISSPGTFLSNFEPLTRADAIAMRDDAVNFSRFTQPMQDLVRKAAAQPEDASPSFFVSSADARLVDGKPSKNPRYLQVRPDITNPQATAEAELANRLWRRQVTGPTAFPVDVVAAGRRNNPPEEGVPPLCAFNPLHYLQLPELFMEFISSMTGKSPSTTGAGSEGALTKAPFNAMPTIFDLNAAFLSFALTGYDGWISCAGYVGPNVRVAHDISLLIPELFARMSEHERDAEALIANGFLEQVEDFDHNGQRVLASRLGYRMTEKFASIYFGRIFMHPNVVFTDEMLRPELQSMGIFAETMETMVTTHQRVAQLYFDDGTVEFACPPLRALLEIMAHGHTTMGTDLRSPEVRELFTAESVLASDWYAARLDAQQAEEVRQAQQGVEVLRAFIDDGELNQTAVERGQMRERLAIAEAELARVSSPERRQALVHTLGREPRFR